MPGSCMSTAYNWLPLTFAGKSKRGGEVPITCQSFGSLSLMLLGTGRVLANVANSPYLALRPDAWVTTLCLAWHSEAGTFHC